MVVKKKLYFCERKGLEKGIARCKAKEKEDKNKKTIIKEYAVEIFTEEGFLRQEDVFHYLEEARNYIKKIEKKELDADEYLAITCIEYDKNENEIDHYVVEEKRF